MAKRGGRSLHDFIAREAASTGQPKWKPTAAQCRVLHMHDSDEVERHGLAWTIDLCQRRTWLALYDAGALKGGRLTDIGRAALSCDPS